MTETLAAPVRVSRVHRQTRTRRDLSTWLLLALVPAVVVAHLILSGYMRVPIIQPDELGYMQNARFLARGGLRSETEYYPGFSLLLVPLWWMSASPMFVFRGALVEEAFIAGIGALVLWAVTKRLTPNLTGWRRALAITVAVAYPSSLLFGNFALAEVTFAVVFAVVVLLAARALAGRQPGWWAALGFTSGALALVHPRGFAVMVAVGILGLVVLGVRKSSVAPLASLAAGLGVGLALTRWLVTYTKGTAKTGFGAYRPDTVLSKSLSLHGLASLSSELAGQLWYLSLATLGLLPLGLLFGLRALNQVRQGDRRPWILTQAFVALSFLGVWSLSSLFMNLGQRSDKLIYGRYNDGVVGPLLIIALAELLTARRRRWERSALWFGAAAATTVVTGAFVQLGHSSSALHGVLNPANVLGVASLLNRMSDHIHVIPMSAIVLTIALVGALLSWRLPVVAIIAVAGLFVWSTVDLQSGYFVPGTRARAGQNDIINTLTAAARLPGVSTACVGWDPGPDHALDYNYYNDRFLIPAQQFQWLTPDQNTPPCGSLMVSADPNLATIYPGARIITSENFVNQSLWAVPLAGDGTYAALAAAGWLSPPAQGANATVALPPDDLKGAGFLVTPPGDFTITPARATDVTVTITHQPGGAPWPNLDALHASSAVFAVRLAVRWYTPEGTAPPGVAALCSTNPGSPVPVACPNWDLPQTLLPGQQAEIPIQLTAFDATGRPLAPGTYIVHLGLYQEGVASFTDLGLNLRVLVTGP